MPPPLGPPPPPQPNRKVWFPESKGSFENGGTSCLLNRCFCNFPVHFEWDSFYSTACVQTSRSSFRWPLSKLNKFKAIVTFHDSEILQSHSMMFLHSTETKLLRE